MWTVEVMHISLIDFCTGETALALAAGAGLTDTVALLLAHGADPNLGQPGSAAPLHRAASSGAVRCQPARDGMLRMDGWCVLSMLNTPACRASHRS